MRAVLTTNVLIAGVKAAPLDQRTDVIHGDTAVRDVGLVINIRFVS